MRELPKSVVERLKSAPPTGAHPDADVLTALAEKALASAERARVLEHVAHCSECRDIVSLALPAAQVLKDAAPVVSLRRLWGWPVLLRAAFAAAVIAVAAVGTLHYQRHTPANTIVARSIQPDQLAAPSVHAESDSAAPGVQTEAAPAPTPQEGASSISTANNVRSGPHDVLRGRAKATLGSLSDRPGAGPTADTKIAMTKSPREFDFALSSQAPSAQTGKQVPATGLGDANAALMKDGQHVQAEALPDESQSPLLDTQTAELRAPIESSDNVTRAKPAISAAAPVGLPMVARNQLDLQQFQKAPMPRWTITSTGGLQRSLDGGKTWVDVNVQASPGVHGGPTQTAMISGKSSAKGAAKEEKKIAAPQSAATPLFRAVAAIGNEVWAGASGGLLYHSADAGANWNSITLSTRGIPMSGDIIRIEFPDALHGRITTSAYETWITSDGGQSWNKQ